MTTYLADALAINDRRTTADGYLVASARAARTGVQTYGGTEVGRPDMAVVRVYRPAEEVFSHDSLASYANKPITMGHPPAGVTAATWKQHAIGHVDNSIVPDGQFVRVPLMIADAAAILEITNGTRELSAGYNCDLDWTAGKTPDGQTYDAIQRRVRINHVAIVPKGRAGSDCRFGDAAPTSDARFLDFIPAPLLSRLNRLITDAASNEVFRVQGAAQGARALAIELLSRGQMVADAATVGAASRYISNLAERADARAAGLRGNPASVTKDTTMNINDSIQQLPHGLHSKIHYVLSDMRADNRMQIESGISNAAGILHQLRQVQSGGPSGLIADAQSVAYAAPAIASVVDHLQTAIEKARDRASNLNR